MFRFRSSLSVQGIFFGLCCVLPGHAFAATSGCPDNEKIYPKHPSIRHLVENKSVQAVNGLRFFLLPPCETPLPVRDPSNFQGWLFRIVFQNVSNNPIKVPYLLPYTIGPVFSDDVNLKLILNKNDRPVFDADYYRLLANDPPRVNIQSIPTAPPPTRSLAPHTQKTPNTIKYLERQVPQHKNRKGLVEILYKSIPPRHVLMQSLYIPEPSSLYTQNASDPVKLAFLYRFHHIAFPYNHPAHYKMQLIFHQEPQSEYPNIWSGTITSNSIAFETVSAKQ